MMEIYDVLIDTDCGPVPARVVKCHDHLAALEEHDRTKSDLAALKDQLRIANDQRVILFRENKEAALKITNLTAENKQLRQRLHAHGDIQTDEEEKEAEELCMGCSTIPFICPDCKFIPIKKEAEDGGDV